MVGSTIKKNNPYRKHKTNITNRNKNTKTDKKNARGPRYRFLKSSNFWVVFGENRHDFRREEVARIISREIRVFLGSFGFFGNRVDANGRRVKAVERRIS